MALISGWMGGYHPIPRSLPRSLPRPLEFSIVVSSYTLQGNFPVDTFPPSFDLEGLAPPPCFLFSSLRSRRFRKRGNRRASERTRSPLPFAMGFTSFAGRVLFASVFIFSAWQEFNEFGVDGGPAAKALKPKFDVFTSHVMANFGVQVPEVEIKHIVAAAIALKGIGGALFIFGSSLGAYLLLLHQVIASPILCDLYNRDFDKKDLILHFSKYTQSLAVLGALLFFLGMKNSIPRRQLKKKVQKPKMN